MMATRFLHFTPFFSIILVPMFFASAIFAAATVPPDGTYTLVALPDTQKYAESYPAIYYSQTDWILNNLTTHNIPYVLQLGDLTDNNITAHWDVAKTAWSVLDGQVPYALAPGNHDYGSNGTTNDRTSYFFENQYFGPTSAYATQSSIGGFYETGKTDNSYHTFTMGDQDWLILTMEFGPRDGVVTWADSVLQSHPDHKAIVVTHAYMYNQSVRYDHELFGTTQSWNPYTYGIASLAGGVNDGQDIYNKMLADNSNVFMVMNGHVLGDGTGYREVIREDGTVLHEMLVNYQFDANGGNGFMRLFEFLPDGSTVNVKSYSPYLDQYDTEPDQDFTITVFDRPVNSNHRAGVLADAPSLYYRLQENNAADPVQNLGSTGTTNTGTYTGSGSSASDFDGTGADYIEVGAMDEMSQWSITTWVRPDAIDTRQTIITNDRSGWHDDVLLGLGPDSYSETTIGHWGLAHHDDDTGAGGETVAEDPNEAIAGQWYHVAATCDGNVMRLYVDGQLVAETEKVGNDLDWGAATNLIGKSYNSSQDYRPFNGTIGEVAVYDHFLSTSDIETQRLAAFNRVTAANLEVVGTTDPGTNVVDSVTAVQQSFPGISAGRINRGDFQVWVGDKPAYAREGVMLATVTQNIRDGVYGSVEVGLNSYSDGILSLSTSRVGSAPVDEININASVAWFPFMAGWKGGHVLYDGFLPAKGYGMEDTTVTKGATGYYQVDLGVDSRTDGMLFTIGAGNSSNVTTTQIDSQGEGWTVKVMTNQNGSLIDSEFSFLYLPYDAENLVGGLYDGDADDALTAFGDFSFTKLANGQYSLSIDGETPETGMLVLSITGDSALENNFITYEASGDDFLIESRDLVSGQPLDDAEFYWAFISFDTPVTLNVAAVPEPSTMLLLLLGVATTLFLRKLKK